VGFDEAGVRRRGWTALAVVAVFVCVLALPALAAAETFTVNSLGDQVDETPGDEFCLTAGGECTLRAGIEEANALAGFDVIGFDETVFGVGAGATIPLADPLPAIVESLAIQGTRECESGQTKPCVGISGPADDTPLTVQGTTEVEIERLAVTDAEVGISVASSTAVKVFGNWFGIKVDGIPGPLQTGVVYGPGSDRGRVGQPSEGQGNLFANNSGTGLALFGASEARVLGNRFGVGPDGSTPAPNGEDIEVSSDLSGEVDAAGNEIGTRVKAGLQGGDCDDACNLISGATGAGLDLQGDGGDEGPAVGTSVVGNYFGLTADGAGSAPNAGAAIRAGAAEGTVVGGAKATDANRFSGGAVAVEAGPGAPDLVVRGNRVGVDGLGGTAPAPAQGVVVDSSGLASPAVEAILAGNELRMAGGTGILQQGFGAWIVGNQISGAATGIRTIGSVEEEGNVIEGNVVSASALEGILLENDLNEVLANTVSGAGVAGVAVRGESPFGVGGNVIGGDSAATENAIGASGGPAIEIENTESSMTTVARNRGAANAGQFIELLRAEPGEPKEPNGGIEPPAIFSAASTGVIGSGAPGATVRVFRKQTIETGEIAGFLGTATVDEDGSWSLAYEGLLPVGTPIAAGQTSGEGGSSELALAKTSGGPGGSDPGPGGGATALLDLKAPRTAILRGPKARTADRTARFRFASDELRTSFQCRLDGKRFRACASPWRRKVRPGRHVFAVRAIDAAGNVDPTPAKRAFTVLAAR